VVKEVDDRTLLTLALIENLQRADLNPIEEAGGYQRLIEEFSLTQQQVADAVGKDRVTVSNLLRLLNLPIAVRRMLEQGTLQPGHARPLLALQEETRILEVAREIAERGLSVREVERLVMSKVPDKRRGSGRKGGSGSETGSTTPTRTGAQTAARRLEDEIRRYLQTDVRVSLSGPDRGTIELSFYSAEDLERILDLMLGVNREAL
jgi:ParB family chromosome partitioning protein